MIQQQLLRAQQRMKHQADAHRSEKEYSVGDLVYPKLQSHIQSSVASRSNHKLAFRYYGPFSVLQRIGAVAYKLNLPATAQIHPVVHVSQLKSHVAPQMPVSLDVAPVLLLSRALKRVGGACAPRVLVQWNMASRLQSWEDEQDLCRRYPDAPAWGQAASAGGGSVMTTSSIGG